MPEGGPVEVVVEDGRWRDLGIEALADRAARAVLAELGQDPDGVEISLLAADDARIAALNAAFRGKAEPTNVLSWPCLEPAFPGEARFIGDLALAFETCAREAAGAGGDPGDHVTHLVVHGVLHLFGHDHQDDGEAGVMEALETKILASLGVANPYRDQVRPLGA